MDKVSEYYLKNGKLCFDVVLELACFGSARGKVNITVLDKTMPGNHQETLKTVVVNKARSRAVISVAPRSFQNLQLQVTMTDAATGKILQTREMEKLPSLQIMSGAFFDRNYYTDEKFALFHCEWKIPPDALKSMKLTAKLNDKVVGRQDNIAIGQPLPVALSSVPLGANKIQVELADQTGALRYAESCVLVKRAPKPGKEWKIDKVNRVVLNNGKPFLPFGIVVKRIKPDEADTFKDLADTGFNSFLCWQAADPKDLPAYCKAAAEHGLYLMPIIDDMMAKGYPVDLKSMEKYFKGEELTKLKAQYSRSSLTGSKGIGYTSPFQSLSVDQRTEIYTEKYRKILPRILEAAGYANEYPATAAYFVLDEPLSDQSFRETEVGRDLYKQIYGTDGYHPIMVNYSSHIPAGDQYVSFMDILMTDPYWVPGGGGPGSKLRQSINWVSKIVAETDRRAKKFRQAVWIIPMAELWSGCKKRMITGKEQECQTYLALINGARGLLYFCYPIMTAENRDAFRLLAKQIKEMEQALLARRVSQEIQYFNATIKPEEKIKFERELFSPENDKFTDVQAKLFKYPGGNCLLLAANCRAYPVDAEFKIGGLATGARRLFGKQRITTRKNSFRDQLEPFGTRAYVFKLPEAAQPANIEIRTTHQSKDELPPARASGYSLPGKRNEQANPSFEETTVKGYPDYYKPDCRYKCIPIGSKDASWGTDDTVAKFGEKSLRMVQPFERALARVYWDFRPQGEAAARYTLSCWLKGNKDGLKVTLRVYGVEGSGKEFAVTQEWQRYHITMDIPPLSVLKYGVTPDILFWEQGTVWVDGVQLEKGNQPTAFEE